MREALVEVFHHDIGFVERKITINQSRQRVVRIEASEILRLVIWIYVNCFYRYAFFREHNAHAVAVMTRSI